MDVSRGGIFIYSINSKTAVILPVNDENSKVIEMESNDIYQISMGAYNLINENCMFYGSSLLGRINGSNYILGNGYKQPIIIADDHVIFSTKSFKMPDAIWYCLDNIYDFYRKDNKVQIEFVDKTKMFFNESYDIFQKQYEKAKRLQEKINRNKSQMK